MKVILQRDLLVPNFTCLLELAASPNPFFEGVLSLLDIKDAAITLRSHAFS